ncbi:MAG TPA: sugar phosphate isomerase/epimerase [Spirochaetia bacterium]
MKLSRLAVQLYSLRSRLATPAEARVALGRVRKIGYRGVEVAGLGDISVSELRAMLDDTGLLCCSTHEPGDRILGQPGQVAERLHALGCTATAYPFPRDVPLSTLRDVRRFAAGLDRAGKILRAAGIELSYHHHDVELVRVGGKTILEWLMELTDPENLRLELDTYWAQAGGFDPAEMCRRYRGRIPLLHLKDYGVAGLRTPVFEEIGQGNLSWPGIVKAADAAKTRWFIVEQDDNFDRGDPFRSIAQSFAYIEEHLAAEG